MYKLTILFFFLTAFNSLSLTDTYEIIFDNENASYTLDIDNDDLVFEDNQPNVTVTPIGDDSDNTDKPPSASGKIYKITKGATWQQGLKIGKDDEVAGDRIGGDDAVAGAKIGADDAVAGAKIGEDDEVAGDRIGEDDAVAGAKIGGDDEVAGDKAGNPLLFGIKEHQDYEIMLSYEAIAVVDKSSNQKTAFPIEDGVYLIIADGKFAFFR